MTKTAYQLLFLFLLISSTPLLAQFTKNDFNQFKLTEGKWESTVKKGRYIEQWWRLNDSVYSSRSYLLTGTDSIPQEEVELRFSNNRIIYAPIVYDQNEGKRVAFPLVSLTKNRDGSVSFLFENKEHDFPQQILYRPSVKALEVITSGSIDGKQKAIPFNFRKIK